MTLLLPKPSKRGPKPRTWIQRNKRPKARSDSDNAKMERALDALWRTVIEVRAQGLCEKCGNEGSDAAHIFARTYGNTRWDPRNGAWLCRECHQELGSATTDDASQMSLWCIASRGPDLYEDVKKQALHGLKDIQLASLMSIVMVFA